MEGNLPSQISKEDGEVLTYFQDRFTSMDAARKEYYDRFEEDEKLFRSYLETSRKADWQSKLFIPRIYGLVMASLSEFAINKPDISVEPDGRSDALRSPYLRAVLYANWRKNKGNAEILFALLDVLKLGIGVLEVGYRRELRTVKEIETYDPETEDIKWKEKQIYDFDDVYFECVNPRYVWVDESANSFGTANDAIRQYIYSAETFHRIFDPKFPKARGVQTKGEVIKDEFFKPFIGSGTKTEEICVYKYINKSKDVLWWIANGILLNKVDDPIPYHHKQLPYTEIKITPYDKYTFYGISLPRICKDLQHEMNTLRNMAVDQTHLNIFSPFFYSAEEDLDESTFVVEPGVGIPVSDPNAFKFFKQSAIGEDAYRLMDRFDDDTRQATGFDLRLQGLPSGGTATETSILKETGLKRINLYLRFLEEFSMPDFAELWKDTVQQFYFMSSDVKTRKIKDSEKTELFRSIKIAKSDISMFRNVESVGDYNFLYVTSDDIRGKFDANVRIGSTIAVSRELNKQMKLQLYAQLSSDPLNKREKLLADVYRAHDMDPEEYMNIKPAIDLGQSIALAEEHNRQILAGETPQVIPGSVTSEHIQIHDALIKSDKIRGGIKRKLIKHTLDEMRISSAGVGMQSPETQIPFTAFERNPQLAQDLTKQPGLPAATVRPETAAETGVAPARPVMRPR